MKISTNNSSLKNRLISLPLFLLMLYATLSTAQIKDYSEVISKKADMIEQKVIDWRHDIHQNHQQRNPSKSSYYSENDGN